MKFVKEFIVAGRWTNGASATFALRNARVVKAPVVSLEAEVRGKWAPRNSSVAYAVTVGNCTDQKQAVALSFVKHGWEEMTATVEPSSFDLAPGETRNVTVHVAITDRVPPGGHEEQVLQAVGNGDAAQAGQLKFITTSELPHPFILHTPERWQEVRDKAAKYPWAAERAHNIITNATAWKVPEVADPAKAPDDTYGPYVFATATEDGVLASAYAYQLTGDRKYAEKVALFLRRLTNPTNGYPKTLRGCNQSLVQEGHWFQNIAKAYDMTLPSGIYSDADQRQVEQTFRLLMQVLDRACDYGPINNWNVSEVIGGFYCSLVLGDLAEAERWFSGPAGICDQLAKGVMDDGWWYECSISYNTWVASEFTQVALAYEPFGVNFRDAKIPPGYSPEVMLATELSGGTAVGNTDEERRKPFGMESHTFGPNTKSYRDVKMMWDSLIPFLDYRSVMFGVNDSTENLIGGARGEIGATPLELAYYVYRDPAYAAVIKNGGAKRDLLYGVPELPEKTPERFRDGAFADNVGLAMLRSQATNRPIREQIQATLHYGTHGWAHGHFDRTDLLSLFRYGRNFWNPESVFWVYEPFMYKFYCQCSVNHNLVVVDQKMQEAMPGERLLFHTGDALQATVVQTDARWSNPPYGGMVYDYVPVKTFAEKCWREGRSVPTPTNAPRYGSLTGFTEPILQRRALLVLDDYIVLVDFVKGANTHTFDNLFQLKGFESLDGVDKKFLRHDAQWNPDPVGSAQFVTDCDWYSVNAPALARYCERFGTNEDNVSSRNIGNDPGVLKLDVHSLWPP
ncbi:MAG TPA: heparinase II/III family protein, partial [Verrucomicrobiae bacterium]